MRANFPLPTAFPAPPYHGHSAPSRIICDCGRRRQNRLVVATVPIALMWLISFGAAATTTTPLRVRTNGPFPDSPLPRRHWLPALLWCVSLLGSDLHLHLVVAGRRCRVLLGLLVFVHAERAHARSRRRHDYVTPVSVTLRGGFAARALQGRETAAPDHAAAVLLLRRRWHYDCLSGPMKRNGSLTLTCRCCFMLKRGPLDRLRLRVFARGGPGHQRPARERKQKPSQTPLRQEIYASVDTERNISATDAGRFFGSLDGSSSIIKVVRYHPWLLGLQPCQGKLAASRGAWLRCHYRQDNDGHSRPRLKKKLSCLNCGPKGQLCPQEEHSTLS